MLQSSMHHMQVGPLLKRVPSAEALVELELSIRPLKQQLLTYNNE
jgi:hypothetical protein